MKNIVPKIGISKCLTFSACRYDGQMIPNAFIEKMKPFFDFVPVDCTPGMDKFITVWLKERSDLDGFLLKTRSPSCGSRDVRLYPTMDSKSTIGKGVGYFPQKISHFFPYLIIESDGRINNARLREHFFTRVYNQAAFREVTNTYSLSSLIRFHTIYKYLYMAYRPSVLKKMGRLVADAKKTHKDILLATYQTYIQEMFALPPRIPSIINALQHCFGYFSKKLSNQERDYFLNQLKGYREKRIPFSTIISLMKEWVVRFQEPYLLEQKLLNPYPEELMTLHDSGKAQE